MPPSRPCPVHVTDRVQKLRKQVVESVPEICPERALILTRAYQEHEGEPIAIKRARALARVLEEMSIYILDGELIVGNHARRPMAAPIFPEFDVRYVEAELDQFEKRTGDRYAVSPETKEALRGIFPFWKGRTVKDRAKAMMPEEVARGGQDGVAAFDNEWTMENGDGHIAIDYPKLLRVGLDGVMAEVEGKLSVLDLGDPDNLPKYYFYRSLLIVYRAAVHFALRYADLADRMAGDEMDPARRVELLEIARVCRTVPAKPAGTFREAIQSIWFAHLVIQIETNGHSISFGRFDQFVFPFFSGDLQRNGTTVQDLFEILCCFWVKLASITKLRSWGPTRYTAGMPMFQNLTVGGQAADGGDAVNELSWLVLDCHDAIRLSQPTLTARVHKGTPHAFLLRCIDVLSRGGGMPAFFNDEIIIPSLLARGVTPEDAVDYCLVGCVEPSIAGKWGGRQGAAQFHLAKCLELTFHGGRDPRTGICLYPTGKTFVDFRDIDELKEEYKKQITSYLRLYAIADNIVDLAWEELIPTPFVSGLVNDCIARGKELKKGGAVYDLSAGQTGHIANVANSLAAVDTLVFREKKIGKQELWDALESNFQGPRGEEIRQLLVNRAPKYGNDDDAVDSVAREVFSHYLVETGKLRNTRWGRGPIACTFHPSTASVSYNVPAGDLVGATPDGRRAREPLADVESPYRGTERSGPTAVIRSVSKLEHILESGGSILNLKFSPSLFQEPRNRENLAALVRTYFDLQGMEVQLDIVSSKTLRQAQKDPAKYPDLLVRVAGYSAYFAALDPSVQDNIIERTEHEGF